MATAKKENAEVKAPKEPTYTVEEFAANPSIFGMAISPDIVTAALRVAGVKETTKSEALKLINKYKSKEVK